MRPCAAAILAYAFHREAPEKTVLWEVTGPLRPARRLPGDWGYVAFESSVGKAPTAALQPRPLPKLIYAALDFGRDFQDAGPRAGEAFLRPLAGGVVQGIHRAEPSVRFAGSS